MGTRSGDATILAREVRAFLDRLDEYHAVKARGLLWAAAQLEAETYMQLDGLRVLVGIAPKHPPSPPRYSAITAGVAVVCNVCGACVVDQVAHDVFHAATRVYNKQMAAR
jgi:hypothetical protein